MINLAVICQLRLIQNYDIPNSVMIAHHLPEGHFTDYSPASVQQTVDIGAQECCILPDSPQMISSMSLVNIQVYN